MPSAGPPADAGRGLAWKLLPLTLLPLAFGSCVEGRATRRLQDHVTAQESFVTAIVEGRETRRQREIGWEAALSRMTSANLSLRQSRKQLEEARRGKNRQWQTLIPNLFGFVSIGDDIEAISNLDIELNAQLAANLNIPNPFEFYAGLYAAALQARGAEWSHELDRRRAFTQLYATFLEARNLEEEQREFELRKRKLGAGSLEGMAGKLAALRLTEESLERRKRQLRLQTNQLLNTPGENWRLTGSVPNLPDWMTYRRLRPGERFGKLALNLMAIQLETAAVGVTRSQVRAWPSLNFGLAAPPLLSSGAQSSQAFNADDLFFFSGANQVVDVTNLGNVREIRDAKTRLELTREQLRLRIEAESVRLDEAMELLRETAMEKRQLEKTLQRLNHERSDESRVVLADLEILDETKDQLRMLESRTRQIQLQLVIWNEPYWKKHFQPGSSSGSD